MREIGNKIQKYLDDFKLKTKLRILYSLCVIIPLVVTDGLVLYTVFHAETVQTRHEMENVANAVHYNLASTVEYTASTAESINRNNAVEEFLNETYRKPIEYIDNYQKIKNSLFGSSMGVDNTTVTIYADNRTIINGGEFARISKVKEEPWYKIFSQSERNAMVMFYYDNWNAPAIQPKRKILFLRKMNFNSKRGCEKVIKMEIDYSSITRDIEGMNYAYPVYICQNGRVLLSNTKENAVGQPFENFTLKNRVGHQKEISLYGQDLQICVIKKDNQIISQIIRNAPLIMFLLLINILLPYFLMSRIANSITDRIRNLGNAFDSVDADELKKISEVRGNDEIATLMHNYNRMAQRTNELIQTVYKDKLREQEINIARKNAELLALHGQINPHFLFNALESIRMHSVLKREYETAEMVEKLAVMERQNVDWGNDNIEIKKEMEFVRAYLGLQKYRFGERLSFDLEVDPECEAYRIPKLTVVTFAENACVHGIESKIAPGWIFVRIFKENECICIEVEDTGKGMTEDTVKEIEDRMKNANIERLKEKGRVGILNACLRLKMATDDKVIFSIESEQGVGTIIQIRIPMDELEIN